MAHYEAIFAGLAPDDTDPKNWTAEKRPKHGTGDYGYPQPHFRRNPTDPPDTCDASVATLL